jgi:hypothetical protein
MPNTTPTNYRITDHANFEIERRNIPLEIIHQVLQKPEQIIAIREGRSVFQSRFQMEDKQYLIRIFVDIDRSPPEVVTVYRTSKINKYWEERQ